VSVVVVVVVVVVFGINTVFVSVNVVFVVGGEDSAGWIWLNGCNSFVCESGVCGRRSEVTVFSA